ncbi:MAG TPA: restriction endonuclease [Micromonosporaceae bacterium]|nr:restriction endonuclease [Micromonosporaceae bacterium]
MARRARRRRRNKTGDPWLVFPALIGAGLVIQAVQQHPVVVALVLVIVAGSVVAWVRHRIRRARQLALYDRNIAVTDGMSGTQFEHYVARLLRSSGCRRVSVCGGGNDMGADIVATLPDGRRLVVQCKRYKGKVGSPEVQRFAGTARDIHAADVAMLVTTGFPSKPAWHVADKCRITIVDRPALARWASTDQLPIDGRPATGPEAPDPKIAPAPPANLAAAPLTQSAAPTDWWLSP